MPLPQNLKTKKDFEQRYVERYTSVSTYELIRSALVDLSDDPEYNPLKYDLDDSIEEDDYEQMNLQFKDDEVLRKYIQEFDDKSGKAPYFTDTNSYDEFLKKLYNSLCEEIWKRLQEKYPESSEFKGKYREIGDEPEDEDVKEARNLIHGLVRSRRITFRKGLEGGKLTKENDVPLILKSLKDCVKRETEIGNPPPQNLTRQFWENRKLFRSSLKDLDEILAPGLCLGTGAPFDSEYYDSTVYYEDVEKIETVFNDRLSAIRAFSKKAAQEDHPENGEKASKKTSVEEMMKARYLFPEHATKLRNDALTMLRRSRSELKKATYFFQNESDEFKAMRDTLNDAIMTINAIGKAGRQEIDAQEIDKKITKIIEDELKKVSEATNAYLVYKEDGPTGLTGASRLRGAKNLRDAIRSMGKTAKNTTLIENCKKNIRAMFGGSEYIELEDMGVNLSEASREIAGYIAPCSGTNLERLKAFYMFDEGFERDYSLAKSNRIDLVFDYLKHPEEANALKKRIPVTKNNYKPVSDATERDFADTNKKIGYRYEGVSYAIRGLTDKIMEKTEPDIDIVLAGELIKVLNWDIKRADRFPFDRKFKSKIDENTRYANALIATADFVKQALALEEKATRIFDATGPGWKKRHSEKEQYDLLSTPSTEEDLNVMLGYAFIKSAASEKGGGMKSVLDFVVRSQAKNPNWTWEETMADILKSNDEELAKKFEEHLAEEVSKKQKQINKDGTETEINGPRGHIMRDYSYIMGQFEKSSRKILQKAVSDKRKQTNKQTDKQKKKTNVMQ